MARRPVDDITFTLFKDESQLEDIIKLIQNDLSEPYSIYVYRYFLHQWPELCFLVTPKGHKYELKETLKAHQRNVLIGVIIAKLERHRQNMRGYIAMLAVQSEHRGRGIATQLVESALSAMIGGGADEICLETETTNQAAMSLYENLGFIRYKRLHRYYLNAGDAFRFILPIKHTNFDTEV